MDTQGFDTQVVQTWDFSPEEGANTMHTLRRNLASNFDLSLGYPYLAGSSLVMLGSSRQGVTAPSQPHHHQHEPPAGQRTVLLSYDAR